MNKPKRKTRGPVVIIVRDGWGENPFPEWDHANAILHASTPVADRLMADYPHTLIATSGNDVGLPDGVMGNSEVGHQNIGAGRIVEQELMRITGRIHDGSFFTNDSLCSAFQHADRTGGTVHVMGLCSNGRVHSDLEHLYAVIDLSQKLAFPGNHLSIHAFMDGRDTPPNEGIRFVSEINAKCREAGVNPVASAIGRFYAMDRDNRWDRVEKAYRLLVHGEGERFDSAEAALRHYYENPTDENRRGDEFVAPSVVMRNGKPLPRITDGDAVIFFNFRGDRPRELTRAFVFDDFPYQSGEEAETHGFPRDGKLDLHFVTMTGYEANLPVRVAFEKPAKMPSILGERLSTLGLSQFRCAETEKYPHVTFFFNDYRDEPFPGEDWKLIPSPRDISTYDQRPEMSAPLVTSAILERLESQDDDVMIINYANGDMVGHTGVFDAAVKAVEIVDRCVGKVVEAVQRKNGQLLVTADHGNAEQMIDPVAGGPHTAHTTYPVRLIVVSETFRKSALRSDGRLADIAPTALQLLGLPIPPEMSGESLVSVE